MENKSLQELWQHEVKAIEQSGSGPQNLEVEALEIMQQNDLGITDYNFGQLTLLFAFSPTFAA